MSPRSCRQRSTTRARSLSAASWWRSIAVGSSIPIASRHRSSGLIFGLTAALCNEITIAKGRVKQSNFNNYRMMRINEAPAIKVHLARNGEAPGGIGERVPRSPAPRSPTCCSQPPAFGCATSPSIASNSRRRKPREDPFGTSCLPAGLVAVTTFGFVDWNVFGSRPTDFAGRDRVALGDTKLADPTGAPASLKDASLIERGRYLIRAAEAQK